MARKGHVEGMRFPCHCQEQGLAYVHYYPPTYFTSHPITSSEQRAAQERVSGGSEASNKH